VVRAVRALAAGLLALGFWMIVALTGFLGGRSGSQKSEVEVRG
jgi:hypothetical protein